MRSEREEESLARLIADLKRPVAPPVGAVESVMVAVRQAAARPLDTPAAGTGAAGGALPAPSDGGVSVWRWLRRRRTLRVSPLEGLIAAGLVIVGVTALLLAGQRWLGQSAGRAGSATAHAGGPATDSGMSPGMAGAPATAANAPEGTALVQFVLVAPTARHVYVVGDFNDWNEQATPLQRTVAGGPWTVQVPLPAGSHLYAFVVDGRWMPDAAAPRAPGDDFGHPNSVMIVRPEAST